MQPERITRNDAPAHVMMLISIFEKRLAERRSFDWLYNYNAALLATLTTPRLGRAATDLLRADVVIGPTDITESAIATMGQVATQTGVHGDNATLESMSAYHAALLSIFRALPRHPTNANDILNIGPKREGYELGMELGWLRGNVLAPNAKRIALDRGLLVGLNDCKTPADHQFRHANIIDGAIASGVTVAAIMEELSRETITESFDVFAAHATYGGLRTIIRTARRLRRSLSIVVGHVSGTLNSEFYAVDENGNPVIGDIGDNILGPFLPHH